MVHRYGYPALVAFSPVHNKYAPLKLTFDKKHIKDFIVGVQKVRPVARHAPPTHVCDIDLVQAFFTWTPHVDQSQAHPMHVPLCVLQRKYTKWQGMQHHVLQPGL